MDINHAGMLSQTGCARFIVEAAQRVAIVTVAIVKQLDGNTSAQMLMHAFVDDSHSACSNRLHNAVACDHLPFHQNLPP